MAKKAQSAGITFDNPIGPGLDLSNTGQVMADAYTKAIGQHTYFSKHPIQATIMGLLSGAGPGGASIARRADAKNQVDLIKGFMEMSKVLGERQKLQDEITGPRNTLKMNQSLIDAGRQAGGVSPDAPDLMQRNLPGMTDTPADPAQGGFSVQPGKLVADAPIPYIAPADQQKFVQQVGAPSDLSAQMALMPQVAKSGLGVFGGPEQQPGQLNTGVSEQQISLPPVIFDPQTMAGQVGDTFRSALGQGIANQKLPNEQAKLIAEAQKLMAEGKVEEARQKLIQAQTVTEQQMPALIKAQTSDEQASAALKNRTDPNQTSGRAATELEQMTPEQRKAYLDRKAYGDGPSTTDVNSLDSLRERIFHRDSEYKYDADPNTLNANIESYNRLARKAGRPLLQNNWSLSKKIAPQGGGGKSDFTNWDANNK